MIDRDFNTFTTDIQTLNENKSEKKGQKKKLVVFLMLVVG